MPATHRRRPKNRARPVDASPNPRRARVWDVDGGANSQLSDEMRAIKIAQMRTLGEQLSDETKAAVGLILSPRPEPSKPKAPTSISPLAFVVEPSDLKQKYGVGLEIPPYRDESTNTERARERESERWGEGEMERWGEHESERWRRDGEIGRSREREMERRRAWEMEREREMDERARVSSKRPRPSARAVSPHSDPLLDDLSLQQYYDIYDPSQLLKMNPYVVVFKNSPSRMGSFLDWDPRTNRCTFWEQDSGVTFTTQYDTDHFENVWHHAAWRRIY